MKSRELILNKLLVFLCFSAEPQWSGQAVDAVGVFSMQAPNPPFLGVNEDVLLSGAVGSVNSQDE